MFHDLHEKYQRFSADELNYQYSPTAWVADFAKEIDAYAHLSQQEYENAPHATLDIAYGDKSSQTLDFFAPNAPNNGYLYVYIHGGYWKLLSKKESAWMVRGFQNKGCSVAVLDYTLCPENTVAGIVGECRNAIAHLVRNSQHLGFDPQKIILCGSSAGGHLVTMMGLTPWREQYNIANPLCGIISVSGLYDVTPVVHTVHNDILQLTHQEAEFLSPHYIHRVPPCPMMIAWGALESSEFIRQSMDYAQKLKDAGAPVTTMSVADKNHFDVVLDFGKDGTDLMTASLALMNL